MGKIIRPGSWWDSREPPRPPNPPEPPDMELSTRVARLESLAEKTDARLAQIEITLARMDARQEEMARHYATKTELAQLKSSIILWVVSAVIFAQTLPILAGLVKHFFPGPP